MSTANHQFIIDDTNYKDVLSDRDYDGHRGYGCIPRRYPPDGSLIPPMKSVQMPLIPESEWIPRIRERAERKQRMQDVWATAGPNGGRIPFLNQGPVGYCWNHGPVHGVMLVRALQNQPYEPLSAFAGAAILKNGRDEGAWGALGLQWAMQFGVPSQKFWPQGSRDLRNDTPEMRADAATRKVSEAWVDLESPVYDRDLTWAQVMTCLLSNQPVVGDFMWWGHCVLMVDAVEVAPNTIGIDIQNSWAGWGRDGTSMGTLVGSRMVPDNAVALRA